MRRVNEIVFGCKVRHADCKRPAFFKYAVEIAEHGYIIHMFQDILAKYFVKFLIGKREGYLRDIMHDIYSGEW